MNSDAREDVRRWFDTPRPSLPAGTLMAAAALVLTGLLCGGSGLLSAGTEAGAEGAGAGLLVGGAILLVGLAIGAFAWMGYAGQQARYKARPTDDEIDARIADDLQALESHALDKTGTDVEDLVGETVVITGPRLWDVSARVKWRQGQDGILRFTPLHATVLNFTKDQVVAYSCALDLFTALPLNESTDEYFYRDIVSVATKAKSSAHRIAGLGMVQMTQAETFQLTTSGGTSVEIILRDPGLAKRMGGGEIPTSRAEKAIQTIRKLLREKKALAT